MTTDVAERPSPPAPVPPGAGRSLLTVARRNRPLIGLVLLLLVGSAVTAWLTGGPQEAGRLDPRSVSPDGARALAQILRDQGVSVELVETTDAAVRQAGPDATVLVTFPSRLSTGQLDRIAGTPADLVVLEPDARELRLAPGVEESARTVDRATMLPGSCSVPAALRAGDIDGSGRRYAATSDAATCYSSSGTGGRLAGSLAQLDTAPGRTVTVLGNAGILTNERLAEHGHAALVLGLLGDNPRVVWYLPSLDDVPVGAGDATLGELLPAGVPHGAVMALLAVVVVAVWRGRRLGAVVTEPLPVVVRAAETTEGRARLYRRAHARDRAAEALRAATRDRLRAAARSGRSDDLPALVSAVAARSGRHPAEVAHLIAGPAPADDRALITLADALDALEKEVRRP